MAWIPIAAWIAVVVIAAVVLGFCTYEIVWKADRLRRDLAQLQSVAGELDALQAAIARAGQRLSSASTTGRG